MHTCIIYKFNLKMMVQVHFNWDFMRKKSFAATGIWFLDLLTLVLLPGHPKGRLLWIPKIVSYLDHPVTCAVLFHKCAQHCSCGCQKYWSRWRYERKKEVSHYSFPHSVVWQIFGLKELEKISLVFQAIEQFVSLAWPWNQYYGTYLIGENVNKLNSKLEKLK